MALIFELQNQDNKVHISKYDADFFKGVKNSPTFDALLSQGIPGTRIIKKLGADDKKYNDKSSKNDDKQPELSKNSTPEITATDASTNLQRIKDAKNKYGDSPKNTIINSPAGKKMEDIFKNVLKITSRKNKQVQPVKPVKPTAKGGTKVEPAKAKEIEMPKGTIRLAASVEPKKVMDEGKKIYLSEEQVLKIKGQIE